jgi:uncharacterized membrane protein YdbT with pleckstrin-like domain
VFAPRDPDEYLLSTERRVIRVRRHWAIVLPAVGRTLLLIVGAVLLSFATRKMGPDAWVVQTGLWYVALVAIIWFAYNLVEWWVERIVVTDKRFMITTGIFTTKVAMMPVTKVTDLTYERHVVGRVMGFGTLIVESAGQIQALNRVEYLPRPEEVYDAISMLVFGDKKGDSRFSMLKAPPRRRRRMRI